MRGLGRPPSKEIKTHTHIRRNDTLHHTYILWQSHKQHTGMASPPSDWAVCVPWGRIRSSVERRTPHTGTRAFDLSSALPRAEQGSILNTPCSCTLNTEKVAPSLTWRASLHRDSNEHKLTVNDYQRIFSTIRCKNTAHLELEHDLLSGQAAAFKLPQLANNTHSFDFNSSFNELVVSFVSAKTITYLFTRLPGYENGLRR